MSNEATVTCPKCGAEIPLTEAVAHRIREQMTSDFERQRQELNTALQIREKKLEAAQSRLAQKEQSVQAEVGRLLLLEKERLFKEASEQAEQKTVIELQDAQRQVSELGRKLTEARSTELSLRQQQRTLEESKANLELEVARQLDRERGKIAETTRQQVQESERLKQAEKDLVIQDLRDQITALKQRAEQGSVQLQGETLEVELQNNLRQAFPCDEFEEVRQGQRGADMMQRARTNTGLECGIILWEAKRAKNWGGDWTDKLKEDQREARAELAVLVSTCVPSGIRGIGQIDGVWVCEPAFTAVLAAALRQGLINVAVQRLQDTGRADKAARLYEFMCSLEFRQHIEGLVSSFTGLQEQLAAEQRAFARQWREREQQLKDALRHTAMLYGSIQGIAGREALGEVKALQLEPNSGGNG